MKKAKLLREVPVEGSEMARSRKNSRELVANRIDSETGRIAKINTTFEEVSERDIAYEYVNSHPNQFYRKQNLGDVLIENIAESVAQGISNVFEDLLYGLAYDVIPTMWQELKYQMRKKRLNSNHYLITFSDVKNNDQPMQNKTKCISDKNFEMENDQDYC